MPDSSTLGYFRQGYMISCQVTPCKAMFVTLGQVSPGLVYIRPV